MADNNVKELITYFNNKDKPHKVRLYKNVPISHIRMGNPYRNYTWSPEDYETFFKSIPKNRISLLTSNIKNIAINSDLNVFENEFNFLNALDTTNLTENEIYAINKIIHLARALVFINDLDENEKFRDPIIVGMLDNERLSIHPGRLRVNALEYLYLKNKKEYYVDVIYYAKIGHDIAHDSFLIDKEYTSISSSIDFANAYGYKTVIDLIRDIQVGNCHIYVDVDPIGQYYINKHISYTKEDFINSILTVEKMIEEY